MRRIVSPVIVDLRDKNGRWIRHIHIQDLKPAPIDPLPNENNQDDQSEMESDGDEPTDEIDDDNNSETETGDRENDENTEPEDSSDE